VTPGFHWYVAWRYLMARPRKVSLPIVVVASAMFLASACLGAIGSEVVARAADVGYTSLRAYRHTLVCAIALFSMAGVALLYGVVSHARRHPGRVAEPLLFVVGLLLLAGGLITRASADRPTQIASTTLIVISGALLLMALLRCWSQERRGVTGPLIFSALMAAAGGATITLARYAVEPIPALAMTYRSDIVLLPGMGLLVLGVAASMAGIARYLTRRRLPRSLAGVAGILLAASAVYPVAASSLLDAHDLVQYQPTGARYAVSLRWVGAVLAVCGLAGGVVELVRALAGKHRPSPWLVQVLAAFLGAGTLLLCFAQFVLMPGDAMLLVPVDMRQDPPVLLLIAVAVLAVGELTLMLGVVRHLFTFFTTVSIAGVAIGTMALVIVLSVMSGFESDLRNKILGSNAHVLITKDEGSFSEYRDITARIENVVGVAATTPYLTSEVVIAANNNYSNVVIKGVDPATVGKVTELEKNAEHPRALERLWPLAEDGAIMGPPRDAGVGDDRPDAGDTGDLVDPPPPDLNVNIDQPTDFSGGELGDYLDPPPPDLDVDIDQPMDFSGGELVSPDPEGDENGDALAEGTDGPAEDMDDMEDRAWADEDDEAPRDAGVVVRPFDPERAGGIFALDDLDTRPPIPPRVARLPGVLVGKELVKQIHLYVGQEVRIVSPLAEDTPAGPVPRTRLLRVADIFYSGMYEYDFKFVYVPLPVLQDFLDLGDEVSGIEIRVLDPDATGRVLRAIRKQLPEGYRVQDWKEINRSLFAALKLEKIAMFLILAIIILVASFSIVGNLIMVVVEKAREIALIKTLGSSNFGIMKIFITQGFFIGVVGTTIGVLHGLVVCALGVIYGLPLNPEVYYIDRLPIHVEGNTVFAVAVAGALISVIATLYPAYVGARMQPLEGLRYE
jgi:lipoprotein-releasing system permease protein